MRKPPSTPLYDITELEEAMVAALKAQRLPKVSVEPYDFHFDTQELGALAGKLPALLVAWNQSDPMQSVNLRSGDRVTFVVLAGSKSFRRRAAATGSPHGPGMHQLLRATRQALHGAVLLSGCAPCVVEQQFGVSYAGGMAWGQTVVTLEYTWIT